MQEPVNGECRVVMAKRVAAKWLQRTAQAEYRFEVLANVFELRSIPGMLRSFRDGKVAVRGVPTIHDLGIQNKGDSLALWSRDRSAILVLKDWFEDRGYETSGVW